ncbi:unnamed protein product [Musa acuminata subsp. malaccensis]|uniref:(wild Malaysian banana) hypothetical protein n=1 Tax=Musa acuminata subsp. malaccensis TaxID=214687 RepID=A0A8D7AA61_MUSAM|nr:unnamed protein product [Musa acuminata subsp. malaccensis]
MHRVTSSNNTSGSTRHRKEKRLTYVLNDVDDKRHCAGINCLSVLKSAPPNGCDYLFTGSRDGTIKRWALNNTEASCSATFESHVDWVNDAVLAGNTLVSCSSDATVKMWNSLSDGACTRTLRQHSDYVTCLAAAEKNSNIVASGGLGGEVFIWDVDAALSPIAKPVDTTEDKISNGNDGHPLSSLCCSNADNNMSIHNSQSHGYSPIPAKGHKESVYALAMNDSGTLLVSGGTEKVVRVWDPRTGSKKMKLKGHTDNIRALLLDSTGRLCLSGSSDSMIRLWDLGQQRCVHCYAVHTDSVWALASTPTFTHVYSGGRDLSLYLTDLSTRESILLCTKEDPILQMALQDDSIWIATTNSSVDRFPAEVHNPQKIFQRGGSFIAGNLSFTRARASLEGSAPVPVYNKPYFTIPGNLGIVQHEILNNRRYVLTKDTAGSVKLWEITKGVVIEDHGKVSFEKKKEELFEMVSIPAWFTADTRLGCLSIHLDSPQCFSAEMYAIDMNIPGAQDDVKINLAQETLRGLLAHWMAKRSQRKGSPISSNGDVATEKDVSIRNLSHSKLEVDDGAENSKSGMLPSFEFSTVSPPSIITEGSHGGPWRKKITDLDGTEDEKDLPWWCINCVLNGQLPQRENTKCSFFLLPCEGSTVPVITQGKLSAPRILRMNKVISYVMEKMVLDKPLDGGSSDATIVLGVSMTKTQVPSSGVKQSMKSWPKLMPSIDILCNNQASAAKLSMMKFLVVSPEMSLATVRTYIWKKPEDLILNYKVVQTR